MVDPDDLAARMAAELDEIERTRMPFGKFGPEHFPPMGVSIYDLPVEYLGWFAKKGSWPRGRLGELLKIVHQMKVDGADAAFDSMRRRAGGKTNLRPQRKRNFHFE
ncbi:putative quorum-sensing-regulated virulence factor [Verrucomicrobiota bacterium sgz303538]